MWKILKPLIAGIVGTKGLCLVYARERFGVPAKYPTALAAWQAVPQQYRHTDQNFPSVPVAVFFTGGDGHVEISIPGVGFDASPYNTATGHIELATIAEIEQHYGVKFAGWSEWLDGVLVAEQIADPTPMSSPVPDTALITHKGTATVTVGPINVRTAPNTSAAVVADYVVGQTFNYDSYIITNGYVWLSYVSNSGPRHYVAEGPNDGNEANVWVKGGI